MCVCVWWYTCEEDQRTTWFQFLPPSLFRDSAFLFFIVGIYHTSCSASLHESHFCLSHCHWSAISIVVVLLHGYCPGFLCVLGIEFRSFACVASSLPTESSTPDRTCSEESFNVIPCSMSCSVYAVSFFNIHLKVTNNKLQIFLPRNQLGSGGLIKTTRNLNYIIDISDKDYYKIQIIYSVG